MIQEEQNNQQSTNEGNDEDVNSSSTEATGGSGNTKRNNDDATKIYLTDNSTLQTPEEYELDKNRDHYEDSQVTATNVEDSETTGNDDTLAGSGLPGVREGNA